MPASIEPRSGLNHSWPLGESGWNAGMDANLLSIGRFAYHLSVKDRDLAVPPAEPIEGDTYIVAVDAEDVWVEHDGEVAVWSGTAWVFGAPRIGWVAYIEDEEVLVAFKSSGWSAGLAI